MGIKTNIANQLADGSLRVGVVIAVEHREPPAWIERIAHVICAGDVEGLNDVCSGRARLKSLRPGGMGALGRERSAKPVRAIDHRLSIDIERRNKFKGCLPGQSKN